MKLGVLDLAGSIAETLALAPRVEELGYTRYWIAEHQPQPSPILTAAIVAGQTSRIRVGTAGVLLHYYPPLRTAHDFRFLERVFPGRIDAGFCPGVSPLPLIAPDLDGRDLRELAATYPERAAKLVEFLRAGDPATAWGDGPLEPPAMWSLGGGRSGELAARLGIGFGYSYLHKTSSDDPDVVRRYRDQFSPSAELAKPACALAVCVVCTPSTEVAADGFFVPRVIGTASECATALAALADRYGVDEVVIADRHLGLAARVRCYELIAEAVGLTSADAESDTARSG